MGQAVGPFESGSQIDFSFCTNDIHIVRQCDSYLLFDT